MSAKKRSDYLTKTGHREITEKGDKTLFDAFAGPLFTQYYS